MNFNENELDAIMQEVAEKARKLQKRPQLLNPVRLRQMYLAHSALQKAVAGHAVEITYELHEPSVDSGSISIVGKNICFVDLDAFFEAIKLANNLDMYTRTDGTVCIDFVFYSLTVLI